MTSKTQELQQGICQRFGWSLVITKLDDARWMAEIITGLAPLSSTTTPTTTTATTTSTTTIDESDNQVSVKKYTFITNDPYVDEKLGKVAVSELALDGLSEEIATWQGLPAKEISHVFSTIIDELPILDSKDPKSWKQFWDSSPQIVGIDTEGNGVSPPVLIQIATKDFILLETPHKRLSANLQRLLQDDTIIKVFCDNFAHKDKSCLGLPIVIQHKKEDSDAANYYTKPPIVDLECLAMGVLGPVKTARGLGRIIALTMPELKVRIEKPKKATGSMKGRFSYVAKFVLIEQKKMKPLRGISDLTIQEQKYAALDAWCTLIVYERLRSLHNG